MLERKRLLCVLLGFVSAGPVACQQYGSKEVTVKLVTTTRTKNETQKDGARAFLVAIEKWNEIPEVQNALQPYRPKDPEAFQKLLEPYRVKSGRTPVTATALPYQTIYVVEYDGKYQWDKIKPIQNGRFKITLE